MSKEKFFKRSKSKWASESAALNDVSQVQNLEPEQLIPDHNEKSFVFKIKEPGIYLKDYFTEAQAIVHAMHELDTFEGNLLPNHTETHFVFSKVR